MKRRDVIKSLTILPMGGEVIGGMLSPGSTLAARPPAPKRNLFKELGITPVINAGATMTFLSGSLMMPEVLEAINSTAHDFANMYELQDKVGAKIAEMLQCEAAMVTSGAACGMLLGTAAAITGSDQAKIKLLPNLPDPRPEVIMQKSHRFLFDQAVSTTGARIVEVEGATEMEQAINANTVMALFINASASTNVSHEEFVTIARRHGVPTFIDAAADVPPVENLFRFQRMGFDLVTFSGGKMIRGPQSTGLLFGRRDLVEAAKLNYSPHEAPIGRPMKINKEEIFGMYAALKSYIERDHEKEWQDWLERINHILSRLASIPGVKGDVYIGKGPANAFPSLNITWDKDQIMTTPKDVLVALKNGTPSIIANGTDQLLNVGVVLLRPEQVNIVAHKIQEILINAMGRK